MNPWPCINLLWLLILALPTTAFCSPAATAYLREIPENCNPKHLSHDMGNVLPCYLAEPDPAYQWQPDTSKTVKVAVSGKNHTVMVHSIQLQSLRWQVAEQDKVSHPVWKHRLTVYQPEKIDSVNALLYINGGTINPKNAGTQKPQDFNDDIDFAHIAAVTKSVVVDLKDIPNQFLSFGEGQPLKEDAIIAYTWKRFLENPEKNYNWPLRLPMVKSTVRTMDTVQSFLKRKNIKVETFVLAGGSKRGWTVWLTAAMDTRVTAIIPMVIDVLNLQDSMQHHYRTYQGWAPAVKDYLALMPTLGTDEMNKLMRVVDPFSYRHLLDMPKYIITASGDDFFLPDSSRFYFDELTGEKWQRVLPDLRHYIVRMDKQLVSDTLEAFYGAFIEQRPLPEIRWEQKQNTLKIHSSLPPKFARLRTAHNPETRDFRKSEDNPGVSDFSAAPVTFKCGSICRAKVELNQPKKGWNAHFIELGFANPPYRDLVFTTEVFITPDVYPEKADTSDKEGKQ